MLFTVNVLSDKSILAPTHTAIWDTENEAGRRVAGLSTPMHRIWMTVKGIAFSLEEIWKAVSVTMFCGGCMSNNWQWYTHFIVVKLKVQ